MNNNKYIFIRNLYRGAKMCLTQNTNSKTNVRRIKYYSRNLDVSLKVLLYGLSLVDSKESPYIQFYTNGCHAASDLHKNADNSTRHVRTPAQRPKLHKVVIREMAAHKTCTSN